MPRSPQAEESGHVSFYDMRPMHAEIEDELNEAWQRVTSTNAYVGGQDVERFEAEWAAYCGTRYAVGVANGTDALTLTLRGLGIGSGDEVIVPATTCVATAAAVMLVGAEPRFVDVDDDTLLITPSAVADAVNERTAAVIPVHLYGTVADVEGINAVADRHGIAVVEDAAQAHGATLNGRKAGSLGHAGCFSFYPAKNLGALGDGGAVVSDDAVLMERVRALANHGRTTDSWYHHDFVGTNSRLDTLQAAMLSIKLSRLDAWNDSRASVVRRYSQLLDEANFTIVGGTSSAQTSAHHLFVVRVSDRDRVREALSRNGIDTGVHYPVPAHRHEPYRHLATDELPVAERAAREVLSLPLFPYMHSSEIERVSETLNEVAA
jgi:dTDP-4-amino-4,6-dideoxygalactose transaminase